MHTHGPKKAGVQPGCVGAPDLERTAAFIRDRVDAQLSGRSGPWLASFIELVAMAQESGVPTGGLQPALTSHLGPDGDGEVLDQEKREALIDALVGRWAAADNRERGVDGSSEAEADVPSSGSSRFPQGDGF